MTEFLGYIFKDCSNIGCDEQHFFSARYWFHLDLKMKTYYYYKMFN